MVMNNNLLVGGESRVANMNINNKNNNTLVSNISNNNNNNNNTNTNNNTNKSYMNLLLRRPNERIKSTVNNN